MPQFAVSQSTCHYCFFVCHPMQSLFTRTTRTCKFHIVYEVIIRLNHDNLMRRKCFSQICPLSGEFSTLASESIRGFGANTALLRYRFKNKYVENTNRMWLMIIFPLLYVVRGNVFHFSVHAFDKQNIGKCAVFATGVIDVAGHSVLSFEFWTRIHLSHMLSSYLSSHGTDFEKDPVAITVAENWTKFGWYTWIRTIHF